MPADRIKEIVDFVTTESPYRSANKGWLTENIFLEWGKEKRESSKGLDPLAKVSIYWQPIIQILSILFLIITLATILAFTPVFLSQDRLNSVLISIDLTQRKNSPPNMIIEAMDTPSSEKELTSDNSEQVTNVDTATSPEITPSARVEEVKSKKDFDKSKAIPKVETPRFGVGTNDQDEDQVKRKVVTATDLFQPRYR